MEKTVVELFAGVGGFRVGLNAVQLIDGKVREKNKWIFVWANQWEPSTKIQPAFECYTKRFGNSKKHVNEDIAKVDTKDIPEHTLLVGGFPCQDYSVARSLSKEKGIHGKKGVLWWEIYRILKDKRPPFVLLENVDRLLKSPSKQRGRDFGIMLKSLGDLGYGVEWRVINAADYGFAQKRRRVFIFAFHKETRYYNSFDNKEMQLYNDGLFAKTFPIEKKPLKKRVSTYVFMEDDLVKVSDSFQHKFFNTGVLIGDGFITIDTIPKYKNPTILRQIVEKHVTEEFYYFSQKQIDKLKELKGSKRIERRRPDGEVYYYSEGSMSFPDDLNKPGRTMLTSEGTINRSSHVIQDLTTKKLRRLTPIEAERLNNFPDDWTNTGMTVRQRYFMMGNALVVNIIKELEVNLSNIIDAESN